MTIDHFDHQLEGVPCKVFFFSSWTSYSHPVQPMGPLYFEQALFREVFYRAWMTSTKSPGQFVLFEKISSSREPAATVHADNPELLGFYRAKKEFDQTSIGASMPVSETIDQESYFVRLAGNPVASILVRQTLVLSYRYLYSPDGTLSEVRIRNPEGKISVLNYRAEK